MNRYPECEKFDAVSEKSQVIGDFMQWLGSEKDLSICEFVEDSDPDCGQYYPVYLNKERLLAEFFEIDLDKVEAERREMLEAVRNGS